MMPIYRLAANKSTMFVHVKTNTNAQDFDDINSDIHLRFSASVSCNLHAVHLLAQDSSGSLVALHRPFLNVCFKFPTSGMHYLELKIAAGIESMNCVHGVEEVIAPRTVRLGPQDTVAIVK